MHENSNIKNEYITSSVSKPFYGKGPHPLLRNGLRAARKKELSGMSSPLN